MIKRLAVLAVCMAFLLSLFGCKDRFMLDGPGMERDVWSAFTLSRCSEYFEPIYSYTVMRDERTGGVYLYGGQTDGEGIRLDSETAEALFAMNILSLPDAEPLCGTFLGLSVKDSKGQVYNKDISSAKENEILALLASYLDTRKADGEEDPFMLDGPGMIAPMPWHTMELSRSDMYFPYNFHFTVTLDGGRYLATGHCADEDGNRYKTEDGIEIPLEAIDIFDLGSLYDDSGSSLGDSFALDAPTISLTLTYVDGTQKKKTIDDYLSIEVYQALLPYFATLKPQ